MHDYDGLVGGGGGDATTAGPGTTTGGGGTSPAPAPVTRTTRTPGGPSSSGDGAPPTASGEGGAGQGGAGQGGAGQGGGSPLPGDTPCDGTALDIAGMANTSNAPPGWSFLRNDQSDTEARVRIASGRLEVRLRRDRSLRWGAMVTDAAALLGCSVYTRLLRTFPASSLNGGNALAFIGTGDPERGLGHAIIVYQQGSTTSLQIGRLDANLDPVDASDFGPVTAGIYLRLREVGGTLYFDTSADSVDWTQRHQTALAGPHRVAIGGAVHGTDDDDEYRFGNVDLPTP